MNNEEHKKQKMKNEKKNKRGIRITRRKKKNKHEIK